MADKQVVVRLSAAGVGPFISQFQAVGGTVQQTAATISGAAATSANSASAIARFAGTAGKALILGLGAGLAISAKAAIDFESSFAGIRKTVDTSEEGFQRLALGMRNLATQIPVNVNELNRIGELGGQLAIPADNLVEFTKVIAQLGVTTNLSTEEAATSFARLANILTIPQDQFDSMASSVVELGNNFATTESEIVAFAMRIAPVGSVVGMTVDQVFGLSAAMSSLGVPAERGGTAIQKTFTQMSKAVADGGEQLAVFAQVAGMTSTEFADAFEQNAARAFAAFVSGLNDITRAGGNVFDVLGDLSLGNERTVQSLLAVGEAGGLLTEALNQSSAAFDQNTALATEAEKRFGTTASRMTLAKNAITDLRIEVGNGLLPVLGEAADTIRGLAFAFRDLSPGTRQAVGALGFLGGALLIFIRNMLKAKKATEGLTWAMAGKKGLVSTISVLGIAAFVGLLTKWAQKTAEIKLKTDELTQAYLELKEGIDDAVDSLIKHRLFEELTADQWKLLNSYGYTFSEMQRMSEDFSGGWGQVAETISGHFKSLETDAGSLQRAFSMGFDVREISSITGFFRDLATEISGAEEASETLWLNSTDRLNAYNVELQKFHAQKLARSSYLAQMADYANEAAEQADLLVEALQRVRDAELASRDSSFGYISAVEDLVGAMADFNAVGGQTQENGFALMQAWNGLRGAALSLGEEGIQSLYRNLQELLVAGAISKEGFDLLTQSLGIFSKFAGSETGTMLLVGKEQIAQGMTEDLDMSVWELTNHLYGLDGAFRGAAGSAFTFAGAASAAVAAINLTDMADRTLIQNATGQSLTPVNPLSVIQQNYEAFSELLGQHAGSAAYNAAMAAGGGAADAVDDILQAALDKAKSSIETFMSAARASLSALSAAKNLREAEASLAALREEKKNLPKEIAAAERELADARREAAMTTIDEQVAIEDAEEAYKRAQLAYRQGLISEARLEQARQQMVAAQQAAVSPDSARVQSAQENLVELLHRQTELPEEIAAAQIHLVEAQLALVDAQMQLIESGQELLDAGPAAIKNFKELAKAAGLTKKEIKHLIRQYAILAQVAAGHAPPSLVLGGTDANTANDPSWWLGPSATPAPIRGLTMSGGGSGTVQSAATQGTALLDSQPAAMTSIGKQVIINGDTVNIDKFVFHLKGIWDVTKPNQLDRLVTILETELRQRARSRS